MHLAFQKLCKIYIYFITLLLHLYSL